MTTHIKSVPTSETRDGRGAGGSDPAQHPKKAFLPCEVNGIKSQALLNTGAEALIISDDLYYQANTCVSKLEPRQKPVLGAKNMPPNVVGETGVTTQPGRIIRAQDKVLVCCGLLQQVLIGIDVLTAHKYILILTLTLSTVRGEEPRKMVFGDLDRVYRITVASLLRYLQIWSQTYRVLGGEWPRGIYGCAYNQLTSSQKDILLGPSGLKKEKKKKAEWIPVRVVNCLNKPLKI